MRRGALAPTVLLAVFLLALAGAIRAAASPVDDYTNAVHRALTLAQFAERGDVPSVQQAIDVLVAGTGGSQPEILSALRQSPPDLAQADQRLQTLYEALQARVDTPNPGEARDQLRQILSQPRYAGLSTAPSWQEQIINFIATAIGNLLSWLGPGGLHLNIPVWVWLLIGLGAILAIIIWPIRGGLSRGGREARLRSIPGRTPAAPDFFAEADRLAGKQDYVGAIKALAGGVAVRLRGQQVWDRSPLTVRELFAQSDRAEALRPLLRSFEEASYGHRPLDADSYARAQQSADPYRNTAA